LEKERKKRQVLVGPLRTVKRDIFAGASLQHRARRKRYYSTIFAAIITVHMSVKPRGRRAWAKSTVHVVGEGESDDPGGSVPENFLASLLSATTQDPNQKLEQL